MICLKHTSNLFAPFLKSLQLPSAFWKTFKLFVRALKKKQKTKAKLIIWLLPSCLALYLLHSTTDTPEFLYLPESMFLIPPRHASADPSGTSFPTYRDFFRSKLHFHGLSYLTTLSKEKNYRGEGQLVSLI